MPTLHQLKCVACRGDEPPVGHEQIAELRQQIPDWQLVERDGVKRLERLFKFKNFAQALEFTNRVGRLAEEEDHHPTIVTEWGRVTVTWWTHKVRGLHQNDFIMAAKTDRVYQPA